MMREKEHNHILHTGCSEDLSLVQCKDVEFPAWWCALTHVVEL